VPGALGPLRSSQGPARGGRGVSALSGAGQERGSGASMHDADCDVCEGRQDRRGSVVCAAGAESLQGAGGPGQTSVHAGGGGQDALQ
ncbi:unnamed protein product, partial [Polarella glacialis]